MVHFTFTKKITFGVNVENADASTFVNMKINLSDVYPRVRDLFAQKFVEVLRAKGINASYSAPYVYVYGAKLYDLYEALKSWKPELAKPIEETMKQQSEQVSNQEIEKIKKAAEVAQQEAAKYAEYIKEIEKIQKLAKAVEELSKAPSPITAAKAVEAYKEVAGVTSEAQKKREEEEIEYLLRKGML